MSTSPVTEPSPRYRYLTDSYVFRWENQTLRADLILTLPVALCLILGIAAGHPAAGMIAAGGAMNTGFGRKQTIADSYLPPMIYVTLGMSVAGFLGVLIGHSSLLMVAVAALLAFGYGMLTSLPGGYGWVGQQCVITYLVASAFPASPRDALARGALLFVGGIIQLVLSSLLMRIFADLRAHVVALRHTLLEEEATLRALVIETAGSLRRRHMLNSSIPYALRLAFVITLGTEIYRELHYPSGYWIPMSALVVLRPAVTDTVNRALARGLGTIAGAAIVTLCLAHVHPDLVAIASFTVLFAWISFGIVNVNYALFSAAITGYIVFLLGLIQIPGPQVAERRTVATLIGVAIALTVRLIVISRYRQVWNKALNALAS
ncbi:MAG: FUSC family protein [Acidobacteriaceae bacterium]